MNTIADLATTFAPSGILRASINVGNPILAARGPAGQASGVSVDLARALAQQLGVELELVVFDSARESVEAVSAEHADIGFFAIDPKRAATLGFTEPYVLIEGAYLVRESSPIHSHAAVDHADNRVVVGAGSAYDLYLSRELKAAQIVRAPTSPAVVDTFLSLNAEVAAGVRQQLMADAQRLGGLRLLEGSFMQIRQAMGLPKSRGEAARQALASFVQHSIASGFVAQALQRHGIEGAAVA
ncbi:MAG: transporter substrate-binding domain-containing protein [Pigmentiphaga sp.]